MITTDVLAQEMPQSQLNFLLFIHCLLFLHCLHCLHNAYLFLLGLEGRINLISEHIHVDVDGELGVVVILP
jgi:hypothetical protein